MISANRKSEPARPRPLHVSKSFSRLPEPSPTSPSARTRSQTFHIGAESTTRDSRRSRGTVKVARGLSDVFELGGRPGSSEDEDMLNSSGKLPPDFDELPIELVGLTDSFVDSLSQKIYSVPPSIDRLSELFQNFYENAAANINTQISVLSSKQYRESSPSRSLSAASRIRAKASSFSTKDPPKPERRESEQQMLTTEEIAERKKNRKVLEIKKLALEEAVERRVCEGIYERIWRHRSTQDEAQDEKLRSKTAALSVVEIGLKELGIEIEEGAIGDPEASKTKESEVRESLEAAREELRMMNDKKYPLGKLQHLKGAHKAIVDTLAHFHPSSSADEIMPMMIYTLITSPPEGINVISNLYFIQRFRAASKIDGEAAYCLTNLEAAVTFLETVDLASLREDEMLSGPARTSSPSTNPAAEQSDPLSIKTAVVSPSLYTPGLSMSPVPASPSSPQDSNPATKVSSLRPERERGNRRLSDLFQPAQALGNAGEAVLKTADSSFTSISNNLNDSYKFFLGKFMERQDSTSSARGVLTDAPKTLDDARKLVGTPPPEDDSSVSGASSIQASEYHEKLDKTLKPPDDKVLTLVGGRRVSRDRSVDSNMSTSSSKKAVAFAAEKDNKNSGPTTATSVPASSNPLESMRNFGKTLDLNPMNRLVGMGGFRAFGRSVPTTPTQRDHVPGDGGVAESTTALPELAESLPIPAAKEQPAKIAAPNKRFMELHNPGDLKISEVMDLLRDYRRLAVALKERGAFV